MVDTIPKTFEFTVIFITELIINKYTIKVKIYTVSFKRLMLKILTFVNWKDWLSINMYSNGFNK